MNRNYNAQDVMAFIEANKSAGGMIRVVDKRGTYTNWIKNERNSLVPDPASLTHELGINNAHIISSVNASGPYERCAFTLAGGSKLDAEGKTISWPGINRVLFLETIQVNGGESVALCVDEDWI